MLDQFDEAEGFYVEALQIYFNIDGKETVNNAKILANLGRLYQTMAAKETGMKKMQLLDRAKDALQDSLSVREKVLGLHDKETILSRVFIASHYTLENKTVEAIKLLQSCLEESKEHHGKE
jgi:tetratricopeptide (TPR) repeat protein